MEAAGNLNFAAVQEMDVGSVRWADAVRRCAGRVLTEAEIVDDVVAVVAYMLAPFAGAHGCSNIRRYLAVACRVELLERVTLALPSM